MVTLPRLLKTPLLHTLGCELPIMLAGMGGVSRHQLAAAVSNAGGFGVLGMVREPVERIRQEIIAFRQLSDGPLAVNLIPAATDRHLLMDQIATCLSLKVHSFVLFWQVDTALIRFLKKEGRQVIYQVGNQGDADLAQSAGADVLIVQGHEAGGHVRGSTSTFTLLPQIVPNCDIPVVAAGGIASGDALLAAFTLGAQGVSLGTAFLATHEANAHPHHKQRVVRANADDTLYTTRFTRNWHEPAPVRVLANAVTRGEYNNAPRDIILGEQDGQPVYLFSTDSPLADATGKVDDMALYCGQSCGQVHQQCSAAERIDQILNDVNRCLKQQHP
ncbi:2-nitropropane dioxygenase [Alcanivorax hongdengensis A-11-3]|uniref:2-nitropropane dioxygenase n=1 Tax=Alcanivorax hongdengensis A-11-3 TaxID=1177179 RepID=L0WAA2_9GAMM|nr:nitronate monooxygenase [Alcanivorax hongdengensis]EKF73012.1 2-nitropropane dioxygenase [Alcanivorax hongdengensis A-11-3]